MSVLGFLLLVAGSGFGSPPSSSKLGIHLIANNTAGVTQICNAHPRVIKILDTHGQMMSAARNYKAGTPEGIVVLRVYTTRRYSISDDPAVSANDFAGTVLLPAYSALSPADRALIDYVEGPNECDSTPCWGSLTEARWYNDFWVTLAPMIADAGFRPCAFSIPVGNPPGSVSEMQQKLAAIVPALRVCKQRGGAWSYHAYTPNWSTDVGFQIWYSLRYRQFYSYFAQAYPDLLDMPLILTECGFDSGGDPYNSGWQANGTAGQYQDWLAWWDGQIRQNSYVVGSTLFQIGSPGTWPSFDLEPIAGWMAGYLGDYSVPVLACSPLTLSASVPEAGDADPAAFTVTNAGYGTMNYSISDDAGWMETTPTTGSSSGETDTVTVTFTAAGLGAGTSTGKITVTAAAAENSPENIDVTLTVLQRPIPGDLNGDRYVDARDVVLFIGCMTGPNAGPPAAGCTTADTDEDGDVDQADFGILQQCLSGDSIPADPDCAGT